jgi:hypothetical protein
VDQSTFATLQCGITIPDCRLVYATCGTLNANRDNVIVYPTRYAGTHAENMYLVGAGKAPDPDKYFIVMPNMLGNGLSSSPSNQARPFDGPRFPLRSLTTSCRRSACCARFSASSALRWRSAGRWEASRRISGRPLSDDGLGPHLLGSGRRSCLSPSPASPATAATCTCPSGTRPARPTCSSIPPTRWASRRRPTIFSAAS